MCMVWCGHGQGDVYTKTVQCDVIYALFSSSCIIMCVQCRFIYNATSYHHHLIPTLTPPPPTDTLPLAPNARVRLPIAPVALRESAAATVMHLMQVVHPDDTDTLERVLGLGQLLLLPGTIEYDDDDDDDTGGGCMFVCFGSVAYLCTPSRTFHVLFTCIPIFATPPIILPVLTFTTNTPPSPYSMEVHSWLMDAWSRGCALLTEVWPQQYYYDTAIQHLGDHAGQHAGQQQQQQHAHDVTITATTITATTITATPPPPTKKRRPMALLRLRAYAELHWRASMAFQWGGWATATQPKLPVAAMPVGMLELVRSMYRFVCHPYKVG